jgi:hypothetical protein
VYTIFSDDEWRHYDYDRYIALFSDISTVACIENVDKYKRYGINILHVPVCCNPINFYPIKYISKKYDVIFIGAAYGLRLDYVIFLIKSGVNIKVFGPGWDKNQITNKIWGGIPDGMEMNKIINQSKICLNFLWTSYDKNIFQIKGRTMELAGSGAFQITNSTDLLKSYNFSNGINIATFESKSDLVEKINFYLSKPKLRVKIARKSYENAVNNFLWKNYLTPLKQHGHVQIKTSFRSNTILIVKRDEYVNHSINLLDLELSLIEISKMNFGCSLIEHDAIIFLNNNSTINNDTIKMMLFAIVNDNADIAISCFYLDGVWIRFIRRAVERFGFFIRLIPSDAIMYRNSYSQNNSHNKKIAYIEYPTFEIFLPHLRSRILKLFSAYYEELLKRNKISISLISPFLDKVFQKVIFE